MTMLFTLPTRGVEGVVERIDASEFSILGFLFLNLAAPIKEELKYRLWLGKFQLPNFAGSVSIFLVDIIVTSLYFFYDVQIVDRYLIGYYCTIGVISYAIYAVAITGLSQYRSTLELFHGRFYLWIFYFSLISFALWHLFFSGQLEKWPVITIVIIHSLSALFFSFVRVYYGIKTAILYHLVSNFPYILINLIALML